MSTLQPLALPADAAPEAWSALLNERAGGGLERSRSLLERLRGLHEGDDAALTVWNELGIELANSSAICSLISEVHPDAGVRTLGEDLIQEIGRFRTDIMLDAEVFARLQAISAAGLDERLGSGAERVLADSLRSYRRSGVDADDAVRDRLRALNERLTELEQAFGRTIRDAATTTRVPASALEGLPDDYVAAHPVDDDGTVAIGTGYPDTNPFLTFSADRDARHAVHATFLDLGWPANDAHLGELLALQIGRAHV